MITIKVPIQQSFKMMQLKITFVVYLWNQFFLIC